MPSYDEMLAQRAADLDAACAKIEAGIALFEQQQQAADRLAQHPAVAAAIAAYRPAPGPAGIFAGLTDPAKARARRAEHLLRMRRSAALAKLRGRPRPPRTDALARVRYLRATEQRLLATRPQPVWTGNGLIWPNHALDAVARAALAA